MPVDDNTKGLMAAIIANALLQRTSSNGQFLEPTPTQISNILKKVLDGADHTKG